jgi:hypothetical protein
MNAEQQAFKRLPEWAQEIVARHDICPISALVVLTSSGEAAFMKWIEKQRG